MGGKKSGRGLPRPTSRSRKPASCTTSMVETEAPCTTSAPSSTGPSGVWCVRTRPPRRSRASSTRTCTPAAETSRAGVRPATPAQMITTSGPVINPLDSSMPDLDQVQQLQSCDGPTFRELYEIYAVSIPARERKPEAWICAMVRAPEYRVWVMPGARGIAGFSILFLPPAERFTLLEYMAVAPDQRNHGVGGRVFRQEAAQVPPREPSVPMLLGGDSDREASADRGLRARRQQVYPRLGGVRIARLHFIPPPPRAGPVPPM